MHMTATLNFTPATPADAAHDVLTALTFLDASLEAELAANDGENAPARTLLVMAAQALQGPLEALDDLFLCLGPAGRRSIAYGAASDCAHSQILEIDKTQALVRGAVALGARADLAQQANAAEGIALALDDLALRLHQAAREELAAA
jgi:hypothetical protein